MHTDVHDECVLQLDVCNSVIISLTPWPDQLCMSLRIPGP